MVRRLGALSLLCVLALATAAASVPAAEAATTRGRAIYVENRPFFPIMQWSQCPNDLGSSLLLGIDVFMGPCEDASAADLALTLGPYGYVIPPIDIRGSLDDARLLGWHQPDEPENNGLTADALTEPDRAHGPTFLTLTSEFMRRARGPSAYRAYVARADIIGFDLYPIAAHCKTHISLADVYRGQRDLLALAPGKPTYQWIETGPIDGRCTRRGPVTPEELRAEVWLAIAGGATGIGYFTHTWTRGSWFRFDVDFPIRAAIERTNREIRALAPVLLARQVAAEAKAPVYAGARRVGDTVYVIAVNASASQVTAQIRIPAAAQLRTARVWPAGTRAAFTAGTIRARFGPLEPRVFILRR
jgi:hypothetical protein